MAGRTEQDCKWSCDFHVEQRIVSADAGEAQVLKRVWKVYQKVPVNNVQTTFRELTSRNLASENIRGSADAIEQALQC